MRKAKDFYDFMVHAPDGDVGVVHDFYFDDDQRSVRYMLVRNEDPFSEQLMLVPILAVKRWHVAERAVTVSLSKQKIETSPAFSMELPISRQYEIALHRFYEWPVYWGQSEFMETPRVEGMEIARPPREELTSQPPTDLESDLPDASVQRPEEAGAEGEVRAGPRETEEPNEMGGENPLDEYPFSTDEDEVREMEFGYPEESVAYQPTLASIREIETYKLYTTAYEFVGPITDVMIDEVDYTIPFIIASMQTAKRVKHIALPSEWLTHFSWSRKSAITSLSAEMIRNYPPYDPTQPITKDLQRIIYRYYDNSTT